MCFLTQDDTECLHVFYISFSCVLSCTITGKPYRVPVDAYTGQQRRCLLGPDGDTAPQTGADDGGVYHRLGSGVGVPRCFICLPWYRVPRQKHALVRRGRHVYISWFTSSPPVCRNYSQVSPEVCINIG